MSFVMGCCYVTHGEVSGEEEIVKYIAAPISYTILLISSMEAVKCNVISCSMFLSMSDQHCEQLAATQDSRSFFSVVIGIHFFTV